MTNTQIRYVSAEEMAFHAARARELRAGAMQAFLPACSDCSGPCRRRAYALLRW